MVNPRTLYDLSREELEQLVTRINEILKEKFKPEPYFNPDDYLLEYRVMEPVRYNSSKGVTVSGVSHIIDRKPEINYLHMHDTDVVDILKDMIRRAEK